MSEATRRPGKRSDMDVPVALAAVAERMFGEQSVESVSLRAVAREAGVAPGAIFYHYPTKDDLVAAVVERRAAVVRPGIEENLRTLVQQQAALDVRSVVDALLVPLVDVLNDDPAGGLNWMKVVAWAALTENVPFYESITDSPDLNSLFRDALDRALGSDAPGGRLRVGIAIFGMLNALAGADHRGYGRPIGDQGIDPDFVETLASFTAAGLAAPVV